jgi:CheY-like chemotaxis protein/HPt (histidine-containing phosphotransfer) domain-containing protein
VERQTYDVVLMDVQMPELDGFEASRELNRRWPAGDRPRIVAMTANAMQGDRELCEAAGMDDYVAKPIRVEELVAALERCRRRAERRGRTGSRARAAGPTGPRASGRADAPATRGAGTGSAGAAAAPRDGGTGARPHDPLASGPAGAAVDPAVVARLAAGMGSAFAAELVDTFTEDARDQIAAVDRALGAGDVDGVRRAAHSLKSTSETVGASRLGAAARELEAVARAGSLAGAGDHLAGLAAEYDAVARALAEIRRGLPA